MMCMGNSAGCSGGSCALSPILAVLGLILWFVPSRISAWGLSKDDLGKQVPKMNCKKLTLVMIQFHRGFRCCCIRKGLEEWEEG